MTYTPEPDKIERLRLTECHHVHNQFWDLGTITHEAHPRDVFKHLTDEECPREDGRATHPIACYVVDGLDANGDLVADVEVSRRVAEQLVDKPIPELRHRSKIDWYGDAADFPDGEEQA
jgi:hypothetical protein